ncbi:MAG TPA: CAP domain-containing protein [Patescibacteria group bacterium]|nr:CAP domain-containing protein [Patescibacteria group bacterium]
MFDLLAHLFTPRHTNNHRPRLIHPEGFFVLTALVLVFHVFLKTTPTLFNTSGSVLGYASSITASQVLQDINAERERAGLKPLQNNALLTQAALSKASDMFLKQYWAHSAPDGTTPWVFIQKSGYSYSIAGENLARDFGDTDSMVTAWMASPTHKANIVQNTYTDTGIAVVDGKYQGVETTLVVQIFGAPANKKADVGNGGSTIAVFAKEPAPEPTPLRKVTSTTTVTDSSPTFSPLQVSKSVFLAMLALLLAVLIYDMFVAHYKKTVRVVGKNLAHIALLITIMIIVIVFKGGSLL